MLIEKNIFNLPENMDKALEPKKHKDRIPTFQFLQKIAEKPTPLYKY